MQNTFISPTMLLLTFMQMQDYSECVYRAILRSRKRSESTDTGQQITA